MKKKLPILFFLLFALHAFGQNGPDSLTQILRNKLQKNLSDTARYNVLIGLANQYIPVEEVDGIVNIDSAKYFASNALLLATKFHRADLEIKSQIVLAYYYALRKEKNDGDSVLNIVLKYYKLRNLKLMEANILSKYGELSSFYQAGNEMKYYVTAKKIYEEINRPVDATHVEILMALSNLHHGKMALAESSLLAIIKRPKLDNGNIYLTYSCLGQLSHLKGDVNQQLAYILKAIEVVTNTANKKVQADDYLELASCYTSLKMYDKAVLWAKRGLVLYQKESNNRSYYFLLNLLIFDLVKIHQPEQALQLLNKSIKEIAPDKESLLDIYESFGNCYAELNEVEKANQSYNKMIGALDSRFKIDSNLNDFTTIGVFVHYYKSAINFYVKSKQYDRAEIFLNKIFKFPKKAVFPSSLVNLYLLQFKVDSADKKYVDAIKNYQLYKALNDSLFNASKSNQIAELEIKYETGQKKSRIVLLETKGKVQQVELVRANSQRNLTLLGTVLFLVTTVLVYTGYRNKQSTNQKLKLKQEEINEKNVALEHLVSEKDWLLKEVHHRVKNNLQLVMSLLDTQSDFLEDKQALTAIRESQNRVQAIALIHQKLYSSTNVSSIELPLYIAELVNSLRTSFDASETYFQFYLNIDDVKLDLNYAVPLGLILNEAVTNALKHAFKDRQSGDIKIDLHEVNGNQIHLSIKDNGVGFSADLNQVKPTSLGMEIMKALSKQINGVLNIYSNSGTEITLLFKYK